MNLGQYECDDGNNKDGDGCSANCKLEKGWDCHYDEKYCKLICNPICGDQLIVGNEQCDDGNTNNNDGCSSVCTLEKGYDCIIRDKCGYTVCKEICGDGLNLG